MLFSLSVSAPFPVSHISRANYQRFAFALENKNNEQMASGLRLAKGEVNVFSLAASLGTTAKLGREAKHFLDFPSADAVFRF
jgi:hypothetical protein